MVQLDAGAVFEYDRYVVVAWDRIHNVECAGFDHRPAEDTLARGRGEGAVDGAVRIQSLCGVDCELP